MDLENFFLTVGHRRKFSKVSMPVDFDSIYMSHKKILISHPRIEPFEPHTSWVFRIDTIVTMDLALLTTS